MNNDLISREALKEATKSFVDCDGFNPVWQIIDNAPTVDIKPFAIVKFDKDELKRLVDERVVEPIKNGELVLQTEVLQTDKRPHGEWEEPFESNGKTYHKCTHCHISSELILFGNFCPNCGADMRGGEDNR